MKVQIAVVTLAYLLLVTTANASPVTLSPIVDGYAESIDWSITIDSDILRADRRLDGSETRSVLEFDISSIPAGMEITSATLNLFAAGSTPRISVQGYAGDGSIDANDFTLDNEITQFDPEPTNNVDVTNFVQGEYLAGSQYAGFQLRELNLDRFNSFGSVENPDLSLRPNLQITYRAPALPEPASLALVVLGVAGLRFARKVYS